MNVVEKAIHDLLKDDATLQALTGGEDRVFNGVIPLGQALPAVVFSQASGTEENLCPKRSIEVEYVVKGVANEPKDAGDIADRLDTLLVGITLVVSGWVSCRKTRRSVLVRYLEQDAAGRTYSHSGATHLVQLEKT